MQVAIVDYGLGNLLSVSRVLDYHGVTSFISSEPQEILTADRLILPGVGAFDKGMENLLSKNLVEPIKTFAASNRPVLGICLGMQLLADRSVEFGETSGLGIVPGDVLGLSRKTVSGESLKIPNIGWNALHKTNGNHSWDNTIFDGVPEGGPVYFVHSYAFVAKQQQHVLAHCEYGGHKIVSAISQGNTYGCQFHPEKSGPLGLKMMKNFIELSV